MKNKVKCTTYQMEYLVSFITDKKANHKLLLDAQDTGKT